MHKLLYGLFQCAFLLLALAAVIANLQATLAQVNSGSVYRLVNQCSNKVLDVSGASTTSGAAVHQWTNVNGSNQQWRVESTSDGFFKLTAVHSGKVLDVFGAGTSEGTAVIQWDSTGGGNQQWKIIEANNGYYKLQARHTANKMLDVSGASTLDGARVQIWTDNGTCAQSWKFELVGGPAPTPTPTPTPSPTPNPIPPDAIVLQPGQDLQAAVNANPDGAKFYLKAGVHRRQRVLPKHGNVFIGEPGAILDGENAQTHAFIYDDAIRHPRDVTIKGLVVERYTNPDRRGTIYGTNTTNWLVEDNEFRYNAGNGIEGGKGMRVLRNKLHHNGCIGVGGYKADGMLIEGNEIAFNNTSRDDPDTATGTCGGMKIVTLRDVIVRNNFVHDNYGPGIWCDIDCNYVTIENNRVVDNTHRGIFYEISYNGIIRNNIVERNGLSFPNWPGGTGIFISSSSDVQVYGNQISDNAGGVTAWDGPRGGGIYGTWMVSNLHVYNNTIRMNQGFTGMGHASNDPAMFNSRNNRFTGNTYYLGANPNYFAWAGASVNEAQWRSFNQDVDGTFYR